MVSCSQEAAAGAAHGGCIKVGRDHIRAEAVQVEQLAVSGAQLQPGRVQVQMAPVEGVALRGW